jgi:hypothetical protein
MLADHGWRSVDELLAAATPEVPSGVAQRAYQTKAKWHRVNDNVQNPQAEPSSQYQIEAGSKIVVRRTIFNALRDGVFERDGDMIRKRDTTSSGHTNESEPNP